MKLGRVNDAFARIGGLDFQIQEILGADCPDHYRNKAIYAIAESDGNIQKGFYRAATHELIPVERCLLQDALADRAADTVCHWLNENRFPEQRSRLLEDLGDWDLQEKIFAEHPDIPHFNF